MRLTRIVYAFRNKVWPKPMEGLDLFIPTVKQDASSSSDSSDDDIDINACLDFPPPPSPSPREKRPRRAKAMTKFMPGNYEDDATVDVEGEEDRGNGVKNFEIEKSYGLKLTLKKSMAAAKKIEDDTMKVSILPCSVHLEP